MPSMLDRGGFDLCCVNLFYDIRYNLTRNAYVPCIKLLSYGVSHNPLYWVIGIVPTLECSAPLKSFGTLGAL